jgi:hypothetical protein
MAKKSFIFGLRSRGRRLKLGGCTEMFGAQKADEGDTAL